MTYSVQLYDQTTDKKLEIIPVKNILFLLRVGNLLMTLKVIKKATNIFKKFSFTE